MSKLGEALAAIQVPVPEPYASQGWVYRDIPGKLSFGLWDEFIRILGVEGQDYKLLIFSQGEDWKRGQFIISPSGMENLKRYSASRKN